MSQHNVNPNQAPGGPRPPDHGQRIAGIVRDSLQSGDLSRLKDLGPAVQDVVNDGVSAVSEGLSGITMETRNHNHVPAPRGQNPTGPYDPRQEQRYRNVNYSQPAAPAYQHMSWPYDSRRSRPAVPANKSGVPLAGVDSLRLPKGVVRIVLGIVGMVTFGLCALLFGLFAGPLGFGGGFAPIAQACGFAFAGCGFVTAAGFGTNKLAKRAKQYYALFDKKKVYTIEEMAALTGRTPKTVKKDIKKMKAKEWLLDLIFDDGETSLMKGEDTYQQYLESRDHTSRQQQEAAERQRRMSDPETAQMEAFRNEGVQTIRKIRSANDAMPGEEISQKLDALESSCARIFSYVEEHPEKLPDTQKFMSYYLPTTLKLVEKYREYQEMDYQPANILEAKKQIEDGLETINLGYKNLLESFYQPDTLDVTTDIVVLQRMLEQEGLVGSQFNIGGNALVAEDDGEIHLV